MTKLMTAEEVITMLKMVDPKKEVWLHNDRDIYGIRYVEDGLIELLPLKFSVAAESRIGVRPPSPGEIQDLLA